MKSGTHSIWVLIILMLVGVVLGGFIGQTFASNSSLGWLNYGQSFGLTSPLVLDLGILALTFGCTLHITIAGIIGIILAIIIYRFL